MQESHTFRNIRVRKNWFLTGILSIPLGTIILLILLVAYFKNIIRINGDFGQGQAIGTIAVFVIPIALSFLGLHLVITALVLPFLPPISRRIAAIFGVVVASGDGLIGIFTFYGKFNAFAYFWVLADSITFALILLASAIAVRKTLLGVGLPTPPIP